MKCKGVPKSALAKKSFEDYYTMCMKGYEDTVEFRRIASYAHRILHIAQTKRALVQQRQGLHDRR